MIVSHLSLSQGKLNLLDRDIREEWVWGGVGIREKWSMGRNWH